MYSSMEITMLVLAIFVGFGLFCYVFFTRQTKNTLMAILPKYKKRYVICHMQYQAGLEDVYNIVPNPKGLTEVGKYSYMLKDEYVILTHKKRKHFVLDENNVIPKTFAKQTDETIIYQSAEIQTALDNTVMEYLFSKKKELLIMGLFIVAIIAILAILYNVYELQGINSYIHQTQQAALEIQPMTPIGK